MPQNWLKIKKARSDLTDYLIHWTRSSNADGVRRSPFEVLQSILECGYLKPSFATRTSAFASGPGRHTVRGPRPAVCFTEQPLSAFLNSCGALPNRYKPYAVAVKKDRLFEYGGRPVIYGDSNLLHSLPDHQKFLWVPFQPTPNASLGGYPIDWTHEREWRSTVNNYNASAHGAYLTDGVPLLLPPTESNLFLPWVLVRSRAEAVEMRRWMNCLPDYAGSNVLMSLYRAKLRHTPIIPLDVVAERLSNGESLWARIDTLPYSELEPEVAEQFERLGWDSA